MGEMEEEKFFHQMRLIFTYYASQGNKEDPLVMREKGFNKFLTDSTISELMKGQEKYIQESKKSSRFKRKESLNNKINVIVNTFHKPMHYNQFQKILTDLIISVRSPTKDQDFEEDEKVQKDLYKVYQQDEIFAGIFQFLYEEIEQGTEFGNLIIFSQNKTFLDQQLWNEVNTHQNLLKTIYFHYFTSVLRKHQNGIQQIINILKKFCLQFQIAPLKVSMTQVFILTWEIMGFKSKSIYQQNYSLEDKNSQFKNCEQWPQFTYYSFVKFLILVASLLQFRDSKSQSSFQDSRKLRNLFESLGTTKGFKHIRSLYKLNHSFYLCDLKKPNTQEQYDCDKVLHFEPKILEDSKLTQVLNSFEKLLDMIFRSYTENRNSQSMSKKIFEQFCSEFKIIPHLVTKKEISQIYHKLFFERDYFYVSESSKNQTQSQRIIENNKLKISQLLLKPEYGLKLVEFKKVFAYGAELNKISDKLTPVERLIYWIEYIFSQDKTKVLIERSRTREKFFVEKQINLFSIYKKPLAGQGTENNFYSEHESMYKKLKKTLK